MTEKIKDKKWMIYVGFFLLLLIVFFLTCFGMQSMFEYDPEEEEPVEEE